MAPVRTSEKKSPAEGSESATWPPDLREHLGTVRGVHGPRPQRGHSGHPRMVPGWGGDKTRPQRVSGALWELYLGPAFICPSPSPGSRSPQE